MWVTDENNRRIISILGRIIGGNFQELQNRVIGKIKSILGSGLPVILSGMVQGVRVKVVAAATTFPTL